MALMGLGLVRLGVEELPVCTSAFRQAQTSKNRNSFLTRERLFLGLEEDKGRYWH